MMPHHLNESEIRSFFGQMQCGKQGTCAGTHVCGMWHPAGYVPDVVYYANQRKADFNSPKTPNKNEEETKKEEGYSKKENKKNNNSMEECLSVSSDSENEWESKEKMFNPVVSPRKFVITGLRNLGNSCYLNAIIQNLKNLPKFLYELTQHNSEPMTGGVTAEIVELIRKMQTEQYKVISPTAFKKAVKRSIPHFDDGKQQDAQEFVTWLLDSIENEKTTADKSLGMFYGSYENVLECMKCKRRTEKTEKFNCLTLAIPQKSGKITLADCMKLAQNTEEIERDCNRCECIQETCTCDLESKCKSVKAKKTLRIQKYPDVLMIQIKRFEEDKKNNKHVDIPMKLKKENNFYNLVGTVEHSGAPNGGHYKAKCWDEKRNKWYMMDDGNVEPIKPSAVNTEKAYLLFYSKKREEKVEEETQRRSNRQSCKSEKAKALERDEAEKMKNKKSKDKGKVAPTEETNKKYCICNRPYDEEIHECMMSCDRCEEWYHCDCIGFTCIKCEVLEKTQVYAELKNVKSELEEKRSEIVKLKNEIKCQKLEKISQEEQDAYRSLEKKHDMTITRLKIAEKENAKLRKEAEKNKEEMKRMVENNQKKETTDHGVDQANPDENGSGKCNEKDDENKSTRAESEESEIKKENKKMKLLIKKKDRLITELQGEKQKAVAENLEATRTIRNLNNNIDRLMKEEGEKRNMDKNKMNVSRTANGKIQKKEDKDEKNTSTQNEEKRKNDEEEPKITKED